MRVIREQTVPSFAAHAWQQSGRMCGFESFTNRLTNENVSRRGRSNMICAGEMLQSGSEDVVQLQHGAQEAVMVDAACRASGGHKKTLRSFYGQFSSAIRMAELPRILFGHEGGNLRSTRLTLPHPCHQMAEARPPGGRCSQKKISSQILRKSPGVCCYRTLLVSEQFLCHRKFVAK